MAEPLKNFLNRKYITDISKAFKKAYRTFPDQKFIKDVLNKNWKNLELKERQTHICNSLRKNLPEDYKKALPIVLKAAPNFGGYEALFFPEFVSSFGMDEKHRKISLDALEELTQYSSSELAVRPFILEDPEKMMKWILKLSKHKNYHMRRLASEGCRPRLPWAMALPMFKKDPTLILPILDNLKDDPELYVRRSVANNINDICKDNPTVALKLLKKWKKESPTEEVLWVISHALRSLIKQGNKEALALMGVKADKSIKVSPLKLSKKSLKLGDSLSLRCEIKNSSKSKKKVMLDYIVHHYKKNGTHSPKVFKLKKFEMEPGEKLEISKVHKILKITTRQYYSGDHFIQLQVNGIPQKKEKFKLTVN